MNRFFVSTLISFWVLSFPIFSQHIIDNNGESYKYFPGTIQPDAGWTQPAFDDNGWMNGYKSIGYGDDDDTTVISQVPAVYVRMPFDVENTADYQDLNLTVDYDDGFVAYLNGTEIARINMGDKGSSTTYNQLTDRSHEAVNYRRSYLPLNQYFIPSEVVQSLIFEGTNVLAVEVHNDSLNGSDLSLNVDLLHIDWDGFFYRQDRFKKQVNIDSTRLPLFIIETDEMGLHRRWERYPATMSVIHNTEGLYNKPTDTPGEYAGRIELEIRGQSSSEFPKQSFRLETQDIDGNDTSVSILGMPEENDYILFAPYQDKSLMRNPVVFDLADKLGGWNPRTRMCEVILNGEYVGVYNFMETIKRDKDRIDIAKLKDDENSGVDVTGGYILKFDKDMGGLIIVYPKPEDLTEAQNDYIRDFYKSYTNTLFSNKFLDPIEGYWRYMDPDTYIDYVIMSEITKNADAYLYSTYFFKDKDDNDGRLKFGPIWDNDLGFGNSMFQNGHLSSGWQFTEANNRKLHVTRLLQDVNILQDFRDRWFDLREEALHIDSIYAVIDAYADELDGAWQRNYEVWQVMQVELFYPGFVPYIPDSYEDELDIMKGWIGERLDWIDNNITEIFYEYVEYPPLALETPEEISDKSGLSAYPNPFREYVNISFTLERTSEVSIVLMDIHGVKHFIKPSETMVEGTYDILWDDQIPAGLYMLNLMIDNTIGESIKIVKY